MNERPHLTQRHREYLISRKVAPEIALQRGYRSVTHDEARRLHFAAPPGQRLDGLLLPLYDVENRNGKYQLRLDKGLPDPSKPNKVRRYLNQQGVEAKGVFLHPSQQPRLADHQVPRFLTEGVAKVDALASAGYLGLGLTGVWMGVLKSDGGGYQLHPDLERACPPGSIVFMAFDSDQMQNAEVHRALRATSAALREHGVLVLYLSIPAAADGGKQGIDDCLAAGGSMAELIANASTALPELEPGDGASVCRCADCPARRELFERRQVDELERRFLTAPKGKGMKQSLRVPALLLLRQHYADLGRDDWLQPQRKGQVDADGWDYIPLQSWGKRLGQSYGRALEARRVMTEAGIFEDHVHYEQFEEDGHQVPVTDTRVTADSMKAALQKMVTIVHAAPENHGGARWRCKKPEHHHAKVIQKHVCAECGEEAERVPDGNLKLENAALAAPAGVQPSVQLQPSLLPSVVAELPGAMAFSVLPSPSGSEIENAEADGNFKLENAGWEPAQRDLWKLVCKLDFVGHAIDGRVVKGPDAWARFVGDSQKAKFWRRAFLELKPLERHWADAEEALS